MPLIVTSAPESIGAALREVRAAAGEDIAATTLDEGVLLVEASDPIAIADTLLSNPPTFIRHLAPADLSVPLQGDDHDLEAVTQAAQTLLSALPKRFLARPHAVQARMSYRVKQPYSRYAIAAPLRELFQPYGPEDVRHPEIVLAVYWGVENVYLGVWPVSHSLSDWPGGERRFAVTPEQISRAEFKLLEGMEIFGLTIPSSGRALDLGAAPGGWTRLLAERGMDVVAIDPARLDQQVLDLPNVEHWRGSTEDYLFIELRGAHAADPDRFDVIVNDMRLDARDSARLMVDTIPLLRPGGWAFMTLKLPHEDAQEVYHQAHSILSRDFTIIGSRQLFHNRSEVTVALRVPEPEAPQSS